MALLNPSNDFEPNISPLDSDYVQLIVPIEHLFRHIRNWMRRAGRNLVYKLYSVEANCSNDCDEWGVFSKRTMLVFALSEQHAMDLCRNELLEDMPVDQQCFTIDMIDIPNLRAGPIVIGTRF